jgi:hypothetical protein
MLAMKRSTLVACVFAFSLFASTFAPAQATQPSEKHWYKGNLHTHTLWSDGDGFPEMAADWYKSHGYDFLALSDHNVLSVGQLWMPVRDVVKKGGEIAINNYRERFPDVIQIKRDPEKGEVIQIQPLAKVRELLEEPGKFMMIQAEEVTDKFEAKPVHMGAINVAEVVQARHGSSVREVIANNLRAIEDEEKKTGVPAIAHVNHPNFGWGVTAEDLAAVVEEHYFECYNGHPIVHHQGDDQHLSVEKLWDVANTIRLAQLNAAPLMGLGSDDTHQYHVPGMNRATAGRGWVMVHAEKLEPDSIVAALKRGDFYASSGVTLDSVKFDPAGRTIAIAIKPQDGVTYTTQFIGTPKNFAADGKTPLNSPQVGIVLKSVDGQNPTYPLTGDELYVRATITSSQPPGNPSFEGQKQQAWTQPVGWTLTTPADEGKKP